MLTILRRWQLTLGGHYITSPRRLACRGWPYRGAERRTGVCRSCLMALGFIKAGPADA